MESDTAETAEELANVAPRAARAPASDSYIKHCQEAKAHMALFASEGKRGELAKQQTRAALNAYAQLDVPLTVKEAQRRPDWKLFEKAMEEELEGLWESKTLELLPKGVPKAAKVISSKWVFDIKRNPDGSVERYKARLVAKGLTQIAGIHFFETSSPVAQMNSVKLFLSIAAANDLQIHQGEVGIARTGMHG